MKKILRWVVAVWLTIFSVMPVYSYVDCSMVTEIPQSECGIVSSLYYSSYLDSSPSSPPCTLGGISCKNGHVVQFYSPWVEIIEGVFLRRDVNFSILAGLTDLEVIEIRNYLGNGLYTISGIDNSLSSLANLTNLKIIALDDSIPVIGSLANLSGLTNLIDIELGEGVAYLSGLTKLTRVSGDLSNLSGLTNLQVVDLSGTQVSGDLSSLSGLTNLRSINLVDTQVSGDLSSLKDLAKLEFIYLKNTQMTGDLANLSGLTNLQFISLGDTQVSGDLSSLKGLTKLEAIYLGNTQVTGDLSSLSSLTNLQSIGLDDTRITGDLSSLSGLTNLQDIDLGGTQITDDISSLSSLTNLQSIGLGGTQITGDISSLAGLDFNRLYHLDLSNNQLTGEIPVSLTTSGWFFLSLDHNTCLTASDPTVIAFLDERDPTWKTTQRCSCPPSNIVYAEQTESEPADAVLKPGELFIQRWLVRNDSLCDANGYRLGFYTASLDGDNSYTGGTFGGNTHPTVNIPAGETAWMEMSFAAPQDIGTFNVMVDVLDETGTALEPISGRLYTTFEVTGADSATPPDTDTTTPVEVDPTTPPDTTTPVEADPTTPPDTTTPVEADPTTPPATTTPVEVDPTTPPDATCELRRKDCAFVDFKKIGNLTVYADAFKPDVNNPKLFVAHGHVMLGRGDSDMILSVSSDLRMDYVQNSVESIGNANLTALKIKYSPKDSARNIPIYSGKFKIDPLARLPVLSASLPPKLEGLPPLSSLLTITLDDDQVVLKDVKSRITEINVIMSIGDVVLSQSGNSSQEITVSSEDFMRFCPTKLCPQEKSSKKFFPIKSTRFGISNAELKIDLHKCSLTGTAEFAIPGRFGTEEDGFGVTLGFIMSPFAFNTVGGSISSDKIPFLPKVLRTIPIMPPVGVSINKISLLVDNISSGWEKLQLTGKVGMSLADTGGMLSKFKEFTRFDLLSGEVALLIDLAGKIELSGSAKLLEKFILRKAGIGYNGTSVYVTGDTSLGNILTGKLDSSVGVQSNIVGITGKAKSNLYLPAKTPFLGGRAFPGVNADATLQVSPKGINRADFVAGVYFGKVHFDVRIDFSKFPPVPSIIGLKKIVHQFLTGGGRRGLRDKKEHEQAVAVTDDYNVVLIRVGSENGTALFNLTLPDGTVYTPDSTPAPESPEVGSIFFRKNEEAHEAYYAVKQPAQGEYKIEILNAADIGEYQVELWTPNAEPTMTLDTLTTDQVWDGVSPIEITWTDGDTDNDAEIELYYDADNTGNNGALIATGLMEDDTNNTYQWNIEPNVQSGSYYVYAKIDDREHAPVFAYSRGKVIINNPNAPPAPQNVVLTPGDGSITVNWDADTENDNLMGYRVYLSETPGDDVFEDDFGIGLTTHYEIRGLVNGRTYEVAVKAVNENGLLSHFSTPLQAVPNGTTPGGSADLRIDTEASSLKDSTLRIRVENIGEFQSTSAIVAYYNETTVVDSQTIDSIPAGAYRDVSFQIPPALTESVLVKIDEVMPAELRTSNNIAVIEPTPADNYTVHGTLLGKTGKQLGGATIHLGDKTTITDENGNWSISGLLVGKYEIVATKGKQSCVDSEVEVFDNGQYQQKVNYACDLISYGDDNASVIAIWQYVDDGNLRYVTTMSVEDFDAKFQEGRDYEIVDSNGEYLLERLDDAGNTTSKVNVIRVQ